MRRGPAIPCSACGCVLLLWAGTAMAGATADSCPADTAAETMSLGMVDAAISPATFDVASAHATIVDTISPAAITAPISPAAIDDCPTTNGCVDQYLWSLYERTPKIDSVKETDKRKVTVKRKGKTRTIVTTVTRLVDEDFAWKDLKAAEKAGLSPMMYVIGGMDPAFKLTLYHALHVMDDAGLMPGITSAFRDDYRQSIATGNKARVDRSYHGGSYRGGYGHGLAVDLVSVKGATRAERYRSSEQLWSWIDAHGKDVGIGRPYLDRDAPHVGPIDGKEYADKRGVLTRVAAAKASSAIAAAKSTRHRLAQRNAPHAHRRIAAAKPDVKIKNQRPTAAVRPHQLRRTRAAIEPQMRDRALAAAQAGNPRPGGRPRNRGSSV